MLTIFGGFESGRFVEATQKGAFLKPGAGGHGRERHGLRALLRVLGLEPVLHLLIVHVRHEATADAPFFTPRSDGFQVNPKARDREGELVVLKHHVNAFRETNLRETLDRNGIEKLVICGAMSHMCIDAATRAADDFGYKVTVVHDACATHDLEFDNLRVPAAQVHVAFMAALAFIGAKVASTKEYLV
jgi:nicotinamidase-related amidase